VVEICDDDFERWSPTSSTRCPPTILNRAPVCSVSCEVCEDRGVTEISFAAVDDSQVIVSFTVISATRIEGLTQYLAEPTATVGGFFYDLGTTTFDEPGWEARASKLHQAINASLDRVEPIPREVLNDPGTFVRLFVTLPSGAETIDAQTVKRLADANTTIWIDA
jgi:hypothetical protein